MNRALTLAHNGTIFDCDLLNAFTYCQQGQTDSERILAYIVSRMNIEMEKKVNENMADAKPEKQKVKEITDRLEEGLKELL